MPLPSSAPLLGKYLSKGSLIKLLIHDIINVLYYER